MSEQNHLELGRVILDFPIQAYTIKSLHVHEEANAHGSLTLLFIAKGPVSEQDCIRYADSSIRILDDQGNVVGVVDGNRALLSMACDHSGNSTSQRFQAAIN